MLFKTIEVCVEQGEHAQLHDNSLRKAKEIIFPLPLICTALE